MIAARFRIGHLHYIATWLAKRELPLSMLNDLPEVGWVILDGTQHPICAGFIRKVEGDAYAIFDSIVTNPDAPPADRNEALDLLYKTVIEEAPTHGVKRLIGFTADPNTAARSQRHGFALSPGQAPLVLDLTRTTPQI